MLFWNVLIPVAPMLIVVAAGFWRNICPLSTTALLPRHFGFSDRKKLTMKQSGRLYLASVLLLFGILPLRHALFNTSALATAVLVTLLSLTGFILGSVYEWKSAWCSGLCPVHPVEKLYAGKPFATLHNAHCNACQNCVIPCPDSTPNYFPLAGAKTVYHKAAGYLITGLLPGFIWGWFNTKDFQRFPGLTSLGELYAIPVAAGLVTLFVFTALERFDRAGERRWTHIYAAASVSCYYAYRLPVLFGFSSINRDGMLVNLQPYLPAWVIAVCTSCVIVFICWWILVRKTPAKSWVSRPPFASRNAGRISRSSES